MGWFRILCRLHTGAVNPVSCMVRLKCIGNFFLRMPRKVASLNKCHMHVGGAELPQILVSFPQAGPASQLHDGGYDEDWEDPSLAAKWDCMTLLLDFIELGLTKTCCRTLSFFAVVSVCCCSRFRETLNSCADASRSMKMTGSFDHTLQRSLGCAAF